MARDRSTRRFMCHVFRCDTPARTIANTLRDICKRLMTDRRSGAGTPAVTNGQQDAIDSGGSLRGRRAITRESSEIEMQPVEVISTKHTYA